MIDELVSHITAGCHNSYSNKPNLWLGREQRNYRYQVLWSHVITVHNNHMTTSENDTSDILETHWIILISQQ